MPEPRHGHDFGGCKEAVCIDAGRVYDSCSDKDCMEDLRVFFTDRDQMVIDHAITVRAKKAECVTTYVDVEALPFNRGYYACDLTFFFKVECEVVTGRGQPCTCLEGICVFEKKVILFGSEGSVKIFGSEYHADCLDHQDMPTRNLPRCCVQVAEPVCLNSRLADVCDCDPCHHGLHERIPDGLVERFGGCFVDSRDGKAALVTLGLFTIVQLIRNVQMLVPVYDFCVPNKECRPSGDNPCELFRKMGFPVEEFYPPKDDKCGCCER